MDSVPYMSKKEISEFLKISRPTVDKYIDGIWSEIPSRYSRYVIAGRRISLYAMIDFMTYKDFLADEKLRKKVPEFDPIAVARLCGQEGVMI